MNTTKPLLIVVSSPSGGGKSSLCDRLLAEIPGMVYSVSCTTRNPRGCEEDGEDYHFLSEEGFRERIRKGEFLEYAQVHGHLYGTLRSTVLESLSEGLSVLMDIDVDGAAQIRKLVSGLPPDHPLKAAFLDIFIAPPSVDELRRRLILRAEDSPETIALRLRNAEEELKSAPLYRHLLVNDELERACAELRELVLNAQSAG